ncbi:tagatose 6-phosphate kinase [Saccharothrix tamanrassetensis]|uniref:Tagatose 6-phosphate kinase n=1 Tax=Saccharothrix tamanrassetensis TaxID=1051531 RepID=A0A841CSE3_9PSEU|nr:hexose kinase [Saccharothrix tamanrassetensis]MBB5960180.1 tagatose 6-phosphate kinase [Saccharothrix tamanrassetensis]
MIVTVTPNPALDVSYRVDKLAPGTTHRVRSVRERAGGKGFNVSRVLHELGVATLAIGPVGGVLGESIRADLLAAGIRHALLAVDAPTRMTVAVVDEEDATLFNEAGAALLDTEWDRLLDLVRARLVGADVVVCSGSLPLGSPRDTCARIVGIARDAGIPVVVDTSGPALLAAAQAGADVVKPNAAELREVVDADDPVAGAEALRAAGAGAVVLSSGPDGMVAVTGEGRWRAIPPFPVRGNPTGAGDAAVAALANGLVEQSSWPMRLRAAVAWSAAAVAAPVAGSVDLALLHRLYEEVAVEAF